MGFDFTEYLGPWSRHDSEAVADYFTDEATYEDFTVAKTVEGPAGIAGFVRGAELEFSSDFTFTLRSAMQCD